MADGTLIGLALGSSVLAAALTQGFGVAKDRFASGKSANYSALYLAMALEDYGRACSECISQSDMYGASDGAAGSPQTSLPVMPALPETIDWKALGIDITAEALALPVHVTTKNGSIRSTWDVGEHDTAINEVVEAAADIGLKAFELAAKIRKKRNIPALVMPGGWNALMHLTEKNAEYTEENRRVDAPHAEELRIGVTEQPPAD